MNIAERPSSIRTNADRPIWDLDSPRHASKTLETVGCIVALTSKAIVGDVQVEQYR